MEEAGAPGVAGLAGRAHSAPFVWLWPSGSGPKPGCPAGAPGEAGGPSCSPRAPRLPNRRPEWAQRAPQLRERGPDQSGGGAARNKARRAAS